MSIKLDDDMQEMCDTLGHDKYVNEYKAIYCKTAYRLKNDIRNSNKKYKNNKKKLDEIKEKYKNGVTNEILKEWLF